MKKEAKGLKLPDEIEPITGQIVKGRDSVPGQNIFNDLNYGDYLFVFHNRLYPFMYQEVEKDLDFERLLQRRNKRQQSSVG